jgi:nitrogen fixation NifU-like protein
MGVAANLYQEVLLDHVRNPRNFRSMPDANRSARGANPLCGDSVTVYLLERGGAIEKLTFEGSGCAISTASASLMTQALQNRKVEEALCVADSFITMVQGAGGKGAISSGLDELNVFQRLHNYPMRVKCATLAWHTAKAALKKCDKLVTTE